MAKITHVAKAQQRYKMVPVTDAEGNQMTAPVARTTKRGAAVTRKLTVPDRTQPLPPHRCDSCGKDIEVGTSYKHISPRSGPYGGRTLYRHEGCPTWNVWEYSSSLSARLAQISHQAFEDIDPARDEEDVRQVFTDAAEQIRELASEKEESASNIEDGFGHSTSMSDELNEQAEALNGWADDVENAGQETEYPEPEEAECEACDGEGTETDTEPPVTCKVCEGRGVLTPEEPTDEQIDTWKDEMVELLSIVDETPV